MPPMVTTKSPTEALPSTSEFSSILSLHPQEPAQLVPDPTRDPKVIVQTTHPFLMNLWRRRLDANYVEADLTIERLKKVLSTLMLWVSWIHEDVGHSMAGFVYNPVHTPLFIPADGVGIPIVPLAFTVAIHRNFVFVERAKILDEPAPHWFSKKTCKKRLFLFKSCARGHDDKKCYSKFQAALQDLTMEPIFRQCGKLGFYSCTEHVETSASS